MSEKTASLTFCGHATVILETEAGKKFMIDPFLEANPSCPEEFHSPGKIDYICLTHGHSDHAGDAARLAKETGAIVFATFELGVLMAKEGVPENAIQFMNKGGRVEIPDSGGLSVNLTNAFHSSSYDASDGHTYYAGEACGVLIELESGRSVYHAGDTSLFGDMSLIGRVFRPTVALLPIGDRFTMGPRDAAEAVALIKPDKVVPIHYATYEALSGTPEEFLRLIKGSGVTAVVLDPGQNFRF